MYTQNDTFSITDLRHKTSTVLKALEKKGVAYVLQHSRLKAALVDPTYLQALQEAYEDHIDELEFDRTIGLKRIPLSQHKKRLQKK